MSVSRWQKELEEGLNYKNAVILCGNIRDKYLYKEPHTEKEFKLLILKDYLIETLRRRFNNLRFYDPIKKITDYSLAQNPQPKRENPSGDLSQTTPQRTQPSESTLDRDLARISSELTSQTNLCYVIQYTDKTTPAKAIIPDEMKLILRLEKMVENMHATNKVILIYLFQHQIPEELYKNQPKCKVLEIPPPDRAELKTLFKYYYKRNEGEVESVVNISDGLKFLEIEQIMGSVKDGFDAKKYEDRVRLYKFGEEKNYWSEISLNKLNGAFAHFTEGAEGIKGQDEAIETVIDVVTTARADIQRMSGGNPKAPRGVLFFAGPTGVGKTLTAKKLAEFLFGSEYALLRFDMSEYKLEQQVTRLYGASPSYVGFEQGGTLTNAIKAKPFSVILFDEMEKAHPLVLDIFLQILEDGRLTDGKGDTVYFSESIIIFTSNLGTRSTNTKDDDISMKESMVLENIKRSNDREKIKQHFLDSVERFFQYEISRPELLERIGMDNIVIFNYIDKEKIIKGIFQHSLAHRQRTFNESHNKTTPRLNVDMNIQDIVEYLYNCYRERIEKFGARAIKNIINKRIIKEIAIRKLQAEYNKASSATIHIGVEDENLKIELQ